MIATKTAIEFHPVAGLFPLLEDEAFEALVEDVRENGLREPMILHADGRIIDGRNRYRACLAAGVEPQFRTWEGDVEDGAALRAYVLSANLHRRHLDDSQRCMVAARRLSSRTEREEPGRRAPAAGLRPRVAAVPVRGD